MIDEDRTMQLFGYTSSDISPLSKEKVVAVCDECGRYRVTRKDISDGLCRSCAATIGNTNMSPDTRKKRSIKQSNNAKSRSSETLKKIGDGVRRAAALPSPVYVAEYNRFIHGTMVDRILTIKQFGYDPIDLPNGAARKVVCVCEKCGKPRLTRMDGNTKRCNLCANYHPDYAVRSIDEYETFKYFGYHAYDLSPRAHKKVVAVCIGCGTRRTMMKSKCDTNLFCQSCANVNRDRLNHVPDYNIYSIDDSETFKRFGYHANELSVRSGKKVVAICTVCKKSRVVYKDAYTDVCIQCAAMDIKKRRKHSARMQGIPYDEWESFAIDSPYCPKFNEACRESNREKYDRRCFLSDITEEKNGKKLSVHHIDMDKTQGCDGHTWKLVPLSAKWHARAHTQTWVARIQYLLTRVWGTP